MGGIGYLDEINDFLLNEIGWNYKNYTFDHIDSYSFIGKKG